jgi:hypothetical protein
LFIFQPEAIYGIFFLLSSFCVVVVVVVVDKIELASAQMKSKSNINSTLKC